MITRVIMRNEVTVRDIAEAAGVSHTTVLKVLNGRPAGIRVSVATRERILTIVRQSGYRPNRVARDMALGRHTTLGLVMAPGGPDASAVHLAAIEAVLAAAGYRLTLIVLPVDSGAARERVTALLHDGVAGLLCAPSIWSVAAQVVAGMCPVIAMGQGAGETILKALGVEPPPGAEELLSSPVVKLPNEIPAGLPLAPPPTAIPEPLKPVSVPFVKPAPPLPPPVSVTVAAASVQPVKPIPSDTRPEPLFAPSAVVAAASGGIGLEPILTPSPVLEPIPETPALGPASGLSNKQPINLATAPPLVLNTEPVIPEPTAPIREPEPAPVFSPPIAIEPAPEPIPLEGGTPACGEPAEPSPPDTEPAIIEPTPVVPAPSPVIAPVATPPPVENTEPAMPVPTTPIPEPEPAPVFSPPIAIEPAPEPIPLEGGAPAYDEPAEPSPPDTEPAITEPTPIVPDPLPPEAGELLSSQVVELVGESPAVPPLTTQQPDNPATVPPLVLNTEPATPEPAAPIPEPEPAPVFTPPIATELVLNASDSIEGGNMAEEPLAPVIEPGVIEPAPEERAPD